MFNLLNFFQLIQHKWFKLPIMFIHYVLVVCVVWSEYVISLHYIMYIELASNRRYITHTNILNNHDIFRACTKKLIWPLCMNGFSPWHNKSKLAFMSFAVCIDEGMDVKMISDVIIYHKRALSLIGNMRKRSYKSKCLCLWLYIYFEKCV